ncbi:hypothetical protein GFC01_09395 [Desulfofundulus thermobenzoicus]|uniref:PASTA domain-containing protein n=1 Tax=Desulfofundulus thermobenzoicus TaxID=29376 RepID=A0A6N7IR16_9FIRM|nr:hypothetical protein [Desulfofundulus thermobenzoicus]MQL52472.1 hypothetical protein [Desulfofundulus thermobenzoicus]HHW44585.1 hypothetical protein [Desulfotomaculum sp.]
MMNKDVSRVPDVLALELSEALDICAALNWHVEVCTTAPPRDNPGGPLRVVRITVAAPEKAVLTVARENQGKEV